MTAFVPLTVRSHFSMMWGTASPRDLCAAARRAGYTRLALTDIDNLYGLWPFLTECRRHDLTPIVGAEITDPPTGNRAVCLVETHNGFRNLCRLISQRHQDPAFRLQEALVPLGDGLTVLTRSSALLTHWHTAGLTVAGAAPRRPDSAGLRLKQHARQLGCPVIATPGSFFLTPADHGRHAMLRAIDANTTVDRLGPATLAPMDAWLDTPAGYRHRFDTWPETLTAAAELAERLVFTGPPTDLVLPPWTDARNRPAEKALETAAFAGARRRYGRDLPETVVDRLHHELTIIGRMGFASYFLVVRDIVRQSPRICGRGSGAASLVAYCLGITNVCPVRHNLYFERFLNPGRTDPPDIDVDFAWDERDDVQAAVLDRYRGHAAMVCNHVTFRPRMAIREVAKVYGLTDGEIGQVCRRLPWFWRVSEAGDDLIDHLKALPALQGVDFPEPWPAIIRMAQGLIGAPRHVSVHSGGVVITPRPITDYAPVETAPKGVPILQWEKDGTEAAGLVKIDLLGNRSLGVIRDAIADIRRQGQVFDEIGWLPETDPTTQQMVARGGTMGCFYVESPATRLLQKKARVGDFEHLVIHSSIIRPAANAFIREYVRRLHGGAWDPIHPLLTDVLADTYGIMVYQEDVSRTAVALAGFSPADGDGLRKIMSKKDKGRTLEDYHGRFAAGARERGVADDQIRAVWDMMMSFSGYSFCKPHSASYARVSFQAAYLKAHFPAEFMAAVISNRGGFYSTFAYVSEARRLGVAIRHPDVNTSRMRWSGGNGAIQVGWIGLKHVSEATGERLVAESRRRPFTDLPDVLMRVRPDEREARALIHAGAVDRLHPKTSRAEQLWILADWHHRQSRHQRRDDLFTVGSTAARPVFPSDDPLLRLRREYAVLGFLCDRHPMTLFADAAARIGAVKARDLSAHCGRRIRVAGLLITGKTVHTKHGEPMEFLTFEDETGLIECTFFPQAYKQFCARLDRSRPFALTGRVDEDFGACTLTVEQVKPL